MKKIATNIARIVFLVLFFAFGIGAACADSSVWKDTKQTVSKFVDRFRGKENGVKTDKEAFFAKSVAIVVVRMKDVAANCLAGKDIDEQLKKMNEAAKARLMPLEERAKKVTENVNTDEVRTAEIQAALYDTIRTERYQISDASDRAIEKLRENMKQAITNVAKRHNYIVFDNDAVLFGENVKDITNDVVDELNKICPHIEVTLDSGKKL